MFSIILLLGFAFAISIWFNLYFYSQNIDLEKELERAILVWKEKIKQKQYFKNLWYRAYNLFIKK